MFSQSEFLNAIKKGNVAFIENALLAYPQWIYNIRIDKLTIQGENIFNYAIKNGQVDVIDCLLRHEVLFKNNENLTYYLVRAICLSPAAEKDVIIQMLKAYGAKCTSYLQAAILNQNIEKVQIGLARASSPNERDFLGWAPLHYAAAVGSIPILSYFKEQKIELAKKTKAGETPLFLAAGHGHTECVAWFFEQGASLTEKTSLEMTPLLIAAGNGDIKTVEWLLAHGAKLSEKNSHGMTALLTAVANGKTETATWLLKHGAKLSEKNSYGMTALLLAAANGHTKTVAWLLEHGASISEKNNEGENALFFSACNGYTETARWIFEQRGGNIAEKNLSGETALLLAAYNGFTDTVAWLHAQGASLTQKNSNGASALLLAASNGHTDTVAWLVEKGLSLAEKNEDGDTALLAAVRGGHNETIMWLLAHGANLNEKNNMGKTALYIAAFHGYTDTVSWLLQQGANPLTKSKNGYTARDNCYENIIFIKPIKPGFVKMEKLLKKAEENFNSLKITPFSFRKKHSKYLINSYPRTFFTLFSSAMFEKLLLTTQRLFEPRTFRLGPANSLKDASQFKGVFSHQTAHQLLKNTDGNSVKVLKNVHHHLNVAAGYDDVPTFFLLSLLHAAGAGVVRDYEEGERYYELSVKHVKASSLEENTKEALVKQWKLLLKLFDPNYLIARMKEKVVNDSVEKNYSPALEKMPHPESTLIQRFLMLLSQQKTREQLVETITTLCTELQEKVNFNSKDQRYIELKKTLRTYRKLVDKKKWLKESELKIEKETLSSSVLSWLLVRVHLFKDYPFEEALIQIEKYIQIDNPIFVPLDDSKLSGKPLIYFHLLSLLNWLDEKIAKQYEIHLCHHLPDEQKHWVSIKIDTHVPFAAPIVLDKSTLLGLYTQSYGRTAPSTALLKLKARWKTLSQEALFKELTELNSEGRPLLHQTVWDLWQGFCLKPDFQSEGSENLSANLAFYEEAMPQNGECAFTALNISREALISTLITSQGEHGLAFRRLLLEEMKAAYALSSSENDKLLFKSDYVLTLEEQGQQYQVAYSNLEALLNTCRNQLKDALPPAFLHRFGAPHFAEDEWVDDLLEKVNRLLLEENAPDLSLVQTRYQMLKKTWQDYSAAKTIWENYLISEAHFSAYLKKAYLSADKGGASFYLHVNSIEAYAQSTGLNIRIWQNSTPGKVAIFKSFLHSLNAREYIDLHFIGENHFNRLKQIDNLSQEKYTTQQRELVLEVMKNGSTVIDKNQNTLFSLILEHQKTKFMGTCGLSLQELISFAKSLSTWNDIINRPNANGDTLLHLAALQAQPEIVKLLLAEGANSHLQNKIGDTPLHRAARNGRVQIVKILLASQVALDAPNHERRTALYWAVERWKQAIESSADNKLVNNLKATIMTLLYQGANLGNIAEKSPTIVTLLAQFPEGRQLLSGCLGEKEETKRLIWQQIIQKELKSNDIVWLYVIGSSHYKQFYEELSHLGLTFPPLDNKLLACWHKTIQISSLNKKGDFVRLEWFWTQCINTYKQQAFQSWFGSSANNLFEGVFGEKFVYQKIQWLLKKGAHLPTCAQTNNTFLQTFAITIVPDESVYQDAYHFNTALKEILTRVWSQKRQKQKAYFLNYILHQNHVGETLLHHLVKYHLADTISVYYSFLEEKLKTLIVNNEWRSTLFRVSTTNKETVMHYAAKRADALQPGSVYFYLKTHGGDEKLINADGLTPQQLQREKRALSVMKEGFQHSDVLSQSGLFKVAHPAEVSKSHLDDLQKNIQNYLIRTWRHALVISKDPNVKLDDEHIRNVFKIFEGGSLLVGSLLPPAPGKMLAIGGMVVEKLTTEVYQAWKKNNYDTMISFLIGDDYDQMKIMVDLSCHVAKTLCQQLNVVPEFHRLYGSHYKALLSEAIVMRMLNYYTRQGYKGIKNLAGSNLEMRIEKISNILIQGVSEGKSNHDTQQVIIDGISVPIQDLLNKTGNISDQDRATQQKSACLIC